jgi:endoglucanase
VAARLGRRAGSARDFEIHAAGGSPPPPAFAVWDLPAFAFRRGHIHGRACDDLIGVACLLATIIELKRRRSVVNVIGLISRAEEVGFHGALAATRTLPKNSLIVSLETSRELPGVKMGQGVILRVGDRTSIFDARATRFLREVAQGIKATRNGFSFQTGLMSGGTCEATAFQEFGFQTAAVCVALGNYHNCGPKKRIAAEYVSLSDVMGMVELLVAAARQLPRYTRLVDALPSRLRKIRRQAGPALRSTARE